MASKKRAKRHEAPQQMSDTWRAVAVCAFIVIGVTLVFGGTVDHQFVYDDQALVWAGPHIADGLSGDSVKWAFTDGPLGQWRLRFGHTFQHVRLHAVWS